MLIFVCWIVYSVSDYLDKITVYHARQKVNTSLRYTRFKLERVRCLGFFLEKVCQNFGN